MKTRLMIQILLSLLLSVTSVMSAVAGQQMHFSVSEISSVESLSFQMPASKTAASQASDANHHNHASMQGSMKQDSMKQGDTKQAQENHHSKDCEQFNHGCDDGECQCLATGCGNLSCIQFTLSALSTPNLSKNINPILDINYNDSLFYSFKRPPKA